jgi:hypothetical protein
MEREVREDFECLEPLLKVFDVVTTVHLVGWLLACLLYEVEHWYSTSERNGW